MPNNLVITIQRSDSSTLTTYETSHVRRFDLSMLKKAHWHQVSFNWSLVLTWEQLLNYPSGKERDGCLGFEPSVCHLFPHVRATFAREWAVLPRVCMLSLWSQPPWLGYQRNKKLSSSPSKRDFSSKLAIVNWPLINKTAENYNVWEYHKKYLTWHSWI